MMRVAAPAIVLALPASPALQLSAQTPAPAGNAAAGWNFSAQAMETYNSNVFYSPLLPQDDTGQQIQATLMRYWAGPTWGMTLVYTPQVQVYTHFHDLNFFSQQFSESLHAGLGPHTQFSWTTTASHFPANGGMPGSGSLAALVSANPSQLLSPGLDLTTVNSAANLTEAYSPHSSVIATVSMAATAFTTNTALESVETLATPNSTSLSVDAGLTWSHQLTPARSVLVSAQTTELWYTNPAERMSYDSVLFSLQQRVGTRWALLVGAGPSYNLPSRTGPNAALVPSPSTSYAANASLTYTLNSNVYGLVWQHMDELGLTPGGLTTDMLAASYMVTVQRSLSAGLNLGYSKNQQLAASGPAGNISQRGLSLSAQIRIQIASWLALSATHSFTQLDEPLPTGSLVPMRVIQFGAGLVFTPGAPGGSH